MPVDVYNVETEPQALLATCSIAKDDLVDIVIMIEGEERIIKYTGEGTPTPREQIQEIIDRDVEIKIIGYKFMSNDELFQEGKYEVGGSLSKKQYETIMINGGLYLSRFEASK